MQHACAILLPVACLALQYSFTLLKKRHDFLKHKFIQNKMCVLIFSTNLSKTSLILKRTERDIIKMHIGLHVKHPLFLSDFNET
jgi:hypothetical protein